MDMSMSATCLWTADSQRYNQYSTTPEGSLIGLLQEQRGDLGEYYSTAIFLPPQPVQGRVAPGRPSLSAI